MRELFNKLDKYYKENKEFLDLIFNHSEYRKDDRIEAMRWYHGIKDEIDVILGEKYTIDKIKEIMISKTDPTSLGLDLEKNDEYLKKGEYDSAGYAKIGLVKKINKFWQDLDDKSIMDMILGKVEFDLNGGRQYLSCTSDIIGNYAIQTLNITIDYIDNNLYNSNHICDNIYGYLYIPTKLDFLNTNCDKELEILNNNIYNSYIEVKYPLSMKKDLERNRLLKFIKEEDNFVYYKVEIPKGLIII